MVKIISHILLALLLLNVQAAICQTDYESEYQNGVAEFDKKNYSAAKDVFASLITKISEDKKADTYLYLLKSYYFLKDHSSLSNIYNEYQADFTSTETEPESMYILANSLKDNQKDYPAALEMYAKIQKDFSKSKYAAPGSFLNTGVIYIQNLDKPQDGIDILRQMLSNYPYSEYADNAYLEIINGYYKLKDRASIEKTRDELKNKFPDSPQNVKATLSLAEYCIKVERNRFDAIKYYTECYEKYPDSSSSLIAKVRAADLIPNCNINSSIRLYKESLSDKRLNKDLRSWVDYELGFAYLLLPDGETSSIEQLNKVVKSNSIQKYKDKANKIITAINKPESIEAGLLASNLAYKHRDCLLEYDRAENYYAKIVSLWKKGIFDEYIKSPDIDNKQKAECLYQLSLSQYFLRDSVGSEKTLEKIISEYSDVKEYADHAYYSKAFIKCYYGYREDAINIYFNILDKYPDSKIIQNTMREIVYNQLNLNKKEEALITLDGLAYLYPYHIDGKEAKKAIDIILKGNEKLKANFNNIALKNDKSKLLKFVSQKYKEDTFIGKFYRVIHKIELAKNPIETEDLASDEVLISMIHQ